MLMPLSRTISLNKGLRICTNNSQIKKFSINQRASFHACYPSSHRSVFFFPLCSTVIVLVNSSAASVPTLIFSGFDGCLLRVGVLLSI